MILRKPYAFLIKHFQKINFVLLLLSGYILVKNLSFLSMVGEYISTKYYNPIATPMTSYGSFFFYFAIVLILLICGVLIYLLYYKKKPVIVYGLTILEYIAVAIAFLFSVSYFNEVGFNVINMQQTLLVRDILFIVSIPQYAILIILGIRTLGLDLKKFGFREDEEYIEIQEEDREEFEVEVGFDINNVKRTIRQKTRYLVYFFKEHKVVLSLILTLVIIVFSYLCYNNIMDNRSYNMHEVFQANSYNLRINNVYFTDKDYAGDIINQEGRKYIVIDFNITNITSTSLTLDTGKFIISGNSRYYVPIQTHDQYFVDLGKGYQQQELKPNEENNYILIYEIRPEDFGSDFTLYYQEIHGSNDLKLRRINTVITDYTDYLDEITSKVGEEITIDFLNNSSKKFRVLSYQLNDEMTYLYTSCYVWDCRVYEATLKASLYSGSNTLLKIIYSSDEAGLSLTNFFIKQAKLTYKIEDVEKSTTLRIPLTREWKGKNSYLIVPKEVENASEISLEFVVRSNLYRYILKGGEESE